MHADQFDFDALLLSRISRLGRFSNQALERALGDFGLTLQEFRIVGLLIGEPGISQNELASKLSVRPATLSIAIDKLVAKGAIKRTVCDRDKRVKLLCLVPDLDMQRPIAILQQVESIMTAGLDRRELASALKTLEQASENLERALNPEGS